MSSSNINAAQLNYIIYRYLLESQFSHSAFMFHHEARIGYSQIDGDSVQTGILFYLVHKGLQKIEIEANQVKTDIGDDFVPLEPINIITKSENQLLQMVKGLQEERARQAREGAEKQDVKKKGKRRLTKGGLRVRFA